MKNLSNTCLLLLGVMLSCNKPTETQSAVPSTDAVLAKDFRTTILPHSITVTSANPNEPVQNYSGIYTFIYENGKPLKMDYAGSDSSKWSSRITYDAVGNIIKVESIDEGGAEPVIARYYEYTYTGDLLTEKNNMVLLDGTYALSGHTLYRYNEKKQLIKEEIIMGREKPERTLTYEYIDDSTNPSKISTKNFLSDKEYANEITYDTTDSPLVLFNLIRDDVAFALVTKNVKGEPVDPANEKSVVSPLYEYNEKNWPVKITQNNGGSSTTVFDIKY